MGRAPRRASTPPACVVIDDDDEDQCAKCFESMPIMDGHYDDNEAFVCGLCSSNSQPSTRGEKRALAPSTGVSEASEDESSDSDFDAAPAAKAERVAKSLKDSAKRDRAANRRQRTSKKQRVSKDDDASDDEGAPVAPRRSSGQSRKQISYAEGDDDDDAGRVRRRRLQRRPDLHRDLTLVLTSQNKHYRSLRVCFQSSVVDVVFRLLAFTLTDEFFEEDNKVACAMAWLAELVETVHDPKTRRFLTAKRDIICRIVGRLGNRLLDCGFTVQEARREVVATKRSRSHAEMKAMVFGLFFFCVRYYHEPDRPFEMIMLISRVPCSHACAAGDARGCDRFLKAIRADPLKIAASDAPRSVRPAGVWPGGSFDGVFAWISNPRLISLPSRPWRRSHTLR
ncbi:phosphatidylinositol kinase [Aureococcus anophagefferens]|nr:phosphatidylinositol kinase [Aureococcus anophagefferens]